MQVRFWGTRGSIAKPGPSTVRYGGNTSCVQVVSAAGTLLVIDCGTGGHELGQALLREGPRRGHILISHTHWDHIQGIPFFTPLFVPGFEWDFYAPQGFGDSIRSTLAGQMEYTYFPVTPDAFGATVRYNNLSEGTFRIDDVTIRTRFLNHPALTLAFRIEVDGAALVYACDHEPHSRQLAAAEGPVAGQDEAHAEFLRGADLVIHDAQYTAEEYPAKAGWGHSTVEYATHICEWAGVKRLALTHHDPTRTDDAIDEIVARLRSGLGPDAEMELFAAAEGLTIELEAPVEERSAEEEEALPSAEAAVHSAERPLVMLLTGDAALADKIAASVGADNVELVLAESPAGAVETARERPPSMLLIDSSFAGRGEAPVADILRIRDAVQADVPAVVLGDEGTPDAHALDTKTDWLQAPFSDQYLRSRIRTWLMRGEFRWVRASMPEDEAERLAALRALELLDTEREERFDRFTRIAAASLDAPFSLVTLIDADRQWFKSSVGAEMRETSRDLSFCAHALHGHDLMVVPDALLDERFAENPVVTSGPKVRFYAGAPLFVPGGHCVGTLCVLDQRPRELSEKERELLADLGAMVEQELAKRPA
jgi:phosphoribosyl 1,2-cyclic phosphodiesterase/DNA-binding response OmpR family regulator